MPNATWQGSALLREPVADTLRRPLRQYVLKVHSRCDLACDHCYMYEHVDQTWRDRPPVMAPGTVRRAAERIAEHAVARRLGQVTVVLHGGEPLLLGVDTLRAVLSSLRDIVGDVCDLDLGMQSNGVRLTERYADLLLEFRVGVGISLDGARTDNDRHRRFRSGATSHPQTLRALRLLREPRYRPVYAGILCTIDLANDPIRVYEALLAEEPPTIDFLLPHATWDRPPPGHGAPVPAYAAWLSAVHDRWAGDGRPVPIRLFDSIRSLQLGGPSFTEAVGPDAGGLVVVETDGAWEQPDSMKTTRHGAGATGMTVFTHSADEVAGHPAMRRRAAGLAALGPVCQACPVVRQCGGGLVAHRYRAATGFANPSVYCADLKGLVTSMNEHPYAPQHEDLDDLPQDVFDQVAAGYGDARAIAVLRESQFTINRVLVSEIGHKLTGDPEFGAALAVLGRLESAAPAEFLEVLGHPFVRPWVVTCLDPADGRVPEWDRAAALAAAVAIRAGTPVELVVRLRDGRLHLPTLGTFTPPGDVGAVVVTAAAQGFLVRWDGGAAEVADLAADSPGWQPTRSIATHGFRITLEDDDPYRDCHVIPAVPRLSPAEFAGWSVTLTAALDSLDRDAPAQVAGLRAGLRAITPLAVDPGGSLGSATSRHAFGGIGVAYTPDPEALAELIVHEFQHSKLGAVLDVIELVPAAADDLVPVGWRDEDRPIELALQGTYAHLGVADLWRHRAERRPDDEVAAAAYRKYRDWTTEAIAHLRTGDRLTANGTRFVGRLAETMTTWP